MILGAFKRLILFAVFIAAVLFILSFFKNFKSVMAFAWVLYFVFLVLSFATLYLSGKTMTGKLSGFMNIFFVSIFSKLIITAIIVMVYKKNAEPTSDINFIIPSAIIYFSFLFFETYELVKMSRRIGNNQKNATGKK